MPHSANLTQEIRRCIQECQKCHAICLETVQHCLGMGSAHSEPKHIGLLLACAEICQSSANMMLHGSEFHMKTCGVCAEVCRSCAEECRRMASGDKEMIACSDACSRCAESCDQMAHATA